jgi:hypothetical protein
MLNTAHSELVRAEAAAILRYARVAEIKRRALGLASILDGPRDQGNFNTVLKLKYAKWPRSLEVASKPRRPRALFVFPAKYARLVRACRCLQVR